MFRLLIAGFCLSPILGAQAAGTPPRASRAYRRPPASWPREVLDAFFEDASTALEGDQPATIGAEADGHGGPPGGGAAGAGRGSTRRPTWSRWISAETLEDEIKATRIALGRSLASRGVFQADGHRAARRDLGNLAVLLAVVSQYDGPIRWQEAAARLWPRFAETARRFSDATPAAYDEARLRLEELDALLRGERPGGGSEGGEVPPAFADFVERPLVMQRMEEASERRMAAALASPRAFRRARQRCEHEGAMLALLADILLQPAMEYADDEAYADAAQRLRKAGLDIARASRQNNYRAALEADARATRACHDCHDGYRE